MPKLFISYRREDSEHAAGHLYERLEAHFGREAVFMDVDDIPFGVDFRQHLDEAVGRCDILLAVIGEGWLHVCHKGGSRQGQRRLDDPGDFVRIEIESALARGIPVIPVLVGGATMPAATDLPDCLKELAYRNAAEVRPGRDFRGHVDRLIRGIKHLARRQAQPRREPLERPRPEAAPRPPQVPARATDKPAAWTSPTLNAPFVLVPAGSARLGGGGGKPGTEQVTIPQAFYLSVHPVTQAQWQALMGNNPSYFSRQGGGKDKVKDISDADLMHFPVERVSWDDVQEFLKKLNAQERNSGWLYRLPTEAEWEYACRGALVSKEVSAFDFYFDKPANDLSFELANFNGDYPAGTGRKGKYLKRTSKVGEYPANALGLHDMHGNVWEWCNDEEGSTRVVRGGGWDYLGVSCSAASRSWSEPDNVSNSVGFRLLAVPSGQQAEAPVPH
jgi:formylglycine-generating enzyme required for sulfatase activity